MDLILCVKKSIKFINRATTKDNDNEINSIQKDQIP